jgi:hypothetical protein
MVSVNDGVQVWVSLFGDSALNEYALAEAVGGHSLKKEREVNEVLHEHLRPQLFAVPPQVSRN